jgi:Periplasmic copper-binding protein (NosD)/IPT/TIG domain
MRRSRSVAGRVAFAIVCTAVIMHASVGSASAASPRVLFTDVESGPARGGPGNLGAPITIYGTGFGTRRNASQVTIGGVPVARYLVWGRAGYNRNLDVIVVQPGSAVRGGRIVVTVGGRRSLGAVRFRVTKDHIFVVSPIGSDSAGCSAARPCATIAHVARDVMRPGDLLLVRAGTYAEGEVWVRGSEGDSGARGRQKTIAAFPGERPVLANADRPFIVDADYITVAGLAFANGKSLGIPDTGLPGHRGNRFIGNRFRGTLGFAALDAHGDNHLIAGNDCRAQGSTVGTQGHCIYVSYGNGVRLRYNVAGGAPGYGIHVFDQERSAGDFRRIIRNLTIEGNVLTGSTERSGLILAMGDEGRRGNRIEHVTIRGNLLTANNHVGLLLGSNVSDVRITGNRFVQNGRQGLAIADDATVHDVLVSSNRFVQADNTVCRSNCSWYRLAHIEKGARATAVTIRGNRFGPGSPIVLGAKDVAPRH